MSLLVLPSQFNEVFESCLLSYLVKCLRMGVDNWEKMIDILSTTTYNKGKGIERKDFRDSRF